MAQMALSMQAVREGFQDDKDECEEIGGSRDVYLEFKLQYSNQLD